MAVRITYQDLPDVVAPEILRLAETWVRFVPAWCTRLTVSYDTADTDSYCTISASHQQRSAHLYICPALWDLDPQARDKTFLHELAHALHAPVDEAVAQILETGMPRRAAEKVYADAVEGFVNDHAALAWEVSCGT